MKGYDIHTSPFRDYFNHLIFILNLRKSNLFIIIIMQWFLNIYLKCGLKLWKNYQHTYKNEVMRSTWVQWNMTNLPLGKFVLRRLINLTRDANIQCWLHNIYIHIQTKLTLRYITIVFLCNVDPKTPDELPYQKIVNNNTRKNLQVGWITNEM